MAIENINTKTTAPGADYDAIVAQLAAVRDEMAKLAATVAASAQHRSQTLTKDLSDGMAEAAHYVGRKGHETDMRLEGAVAANPYIALGLAAGMGLLLGTLTRR